MVDVTLDDGRIEDLNEFLTMYAQLMRVVRHYDRAERAEEIRNEINAQRGRR